MRRSNYPLTAEMGYDHQRDVNAGPRLPPGFDYSDLEELLALISRLADFLHPGTSHSEPGDEDALKWAEAVLNRHRPAA